MTLGETTMDQSDLKNNPHTFSSLLNEPSIHTWKFILVYIID